MFHKLKSFVAFFKYDNKLNNSKMKHFQQIQSVTVDLDSTNLFILIALVRMVFVIVSPAESVPKKRIIRILKKSRKVSTSEKANRSLPECIFLQVKLVKKYMRMESDVRIKE